MKQLLLILNFILLISISSIASESEYTEKIIEKFDNGYQKQIMKYDNNNVLKEQICYFHNGTESETDIEKYIDGETYLIRLRYDDGKKILERNFKNGKMEKRTAWYLIGKIKYEEKYKNGNLFSGLYYKPTGEIGSEIKNGKGEWLEWYETGKLKNQLTYKKGLLNGIIISWYENGSKSMEGYYKNGKSEGEKILYDETSQPYAVINFKNGEIIEEHSIESKNDKSMNNLSTLRISENYLTGTVKNEKGKQIKNASIFYWFPHSSSPRTVRVDKNGRYKISLRTPPNGRLCIYATADGYSPNFIEPIAECGEYNFTLTKGITIEGYIKYLRSNISNVKITVRRIAYGWAVGCSRYASWEKNIYSDTNGFYKIENVPLGLIEIEVNHNKYAVQKTLEQYIDKDMILIKDFYLQDENNLKIDTNSVILSGQIFDYYTKKPISNAEIQFVGSSRNVYTSENGTFFLGHPGINRSYLRQMTIIHKDYYTLQCSAQNNLNNMTYCLIPKHKN